MSKPCAYCGRRSHHKPACTRPRQRRVTDIEADARALLAGRFATTDTAKRRVAEAVEKAGNAIDAYLILTHSTLTLREQVRQLRSSEDFVNRRRRKLYAEGRIRKAERASHAPVTEAEIAAVRRLWDAGLTSYEIAAARTVTRHRITEILRRAGITAADRPRREEYGRPDLRALFQVDDTTIRAFTARGWLPDSRLVPKGGAHARYTRADILAFLRNRETWVAWEPRQITDPQMRRVAEMERAAAGGRWWQFRELYAALGVDETTLNLWARRYRLFGDREIANWGGAGKFVWLTAAEAAQIEAMGAGVRTAGRVGSDVRKRAASAMRERLVAQFGAQMRKEYPDA